MAVKQVFNTSAELDYPTVLPTLDLDFANSKTLDPRITFTRASGGSYVGADGLIKYAGINEARFDHDPITGESLGFLIEEPRTNLLTWSESFNDSAWSKVNGIVNQNKAIAPDGTLTADEIVTTLSADFAGRNARVTGITNGFHTISFYAKRGNTNWLMITIETAGQGGRRFWYNLQTGTIGSTISAFGGVWPFSAGMEDVGNGFYRCHITVNVTTVGGSITCFAMAPDGDGTFFSTAGNSIYLWGAQLEQGSFPTSYIPTQGSTRTRAADNASITGKNFSEWYRQDEGTVYTSHIQKNSTDITENWGIFSIMNATSTSFIRLFAGSASTPVFNIVISNLSSVYTIGNGLFVQNNIMKTVCSYSSSSAVRILNNNIRIEDTTVILPSNLNNIIIGGGGSGVSFLNGTISRLTYYPKRLPNSQLQALTS